MTTPSVFQSQSLNDWLFYLESQHHQEIDLGLERVQKIANSANLKDFGNSKVILVAGTNGKGTTIRTMELILQQLGYSTGVYGSPHLFRYNERVRINGVDASDEAHVEAFSFIEKQRQGTPLTYFEFGTLAGLYLLQQAKLDYVLIEVGLGGRLDATNILNHDISVITSLGLDHTDWLGDTIEKIGFEKAGIFRSGDIAIVGQPNPPHTVREQAESHNVKQVKYVGEDYTFDVNEDGSWNYQNGEVNFQHLYQPMIPVQNVATALTTLTAIGISVDVTTLNKVLKEITLPGRLQMLSQQPFTMVDVAHNEHAVNFLVQRLTSDPRLNRRTSLQVVVAMMKDKDIEKTLAPMIPLVERWFVADLPGNTRAANSELLAEILKKLGAKEICQFASVSDAWGSASADLTQDTLLLGFGSFYTVAEILQFSSEN